MTRAAATVALLLAGCAPRAASEAELAKTRGCGGREKAAAPAAPPERELLRPDCPTPAQRWSPGVF